MGLVTETLLGLLRKQIKAHCTVVWYDPEHAYLDLASSQGNILPVRSLVEPLQVIMDNGAKRVLIPLSNRRQFMEVPPDIIEKVDPIFYSEPLAAALKALGMG